MWLGAYGRTLAANADDLVHAHREMFLDLLQELGGSRMQTITPESVASSETFPLASPTTGSQGQPSKTELTNTR